MPTDRLDLASATQGADISGVRSLGPLICSASPRGWRHSAIIVTALAAAFIPICAPAGDVTVTGFGRNSCGTWTANRSDPKTLKTYVDTSWVLGFIAGAAVFGADRDPGKGLDNQAIYAWVDNFCRDHPSSKIVDAAVAFVEAHPR